MEHDQEVCSTQSAEEIDNALAKDYSTKYGIDFEYVRMRVFDVREWLAMERNVKTDSIPVESIESLLDAKLNEESHHQE